ncbi:MAG TPA: hypothetical protein VM536_08100 [Chloroflexia bacterium]|nr:hypothetical protein [Chloroflexia bacterium]
MTRTVTLNDAFRADVADLLDLPELRASRGRVHHFDLSEYDHLMHVAVTAHRVSRLLRADARASARAGLMHDLGAHWFNTNAPVALATRLGETQKVRHAIRAHTLLPELPRTREAWAVVAADFITSAQECSFVFGRARTRATERMRRRLPRRMTGAAVPTGGTQTKTRRALSLERRLRLQGRFSPFAGVKPGPYVRPAVALPQNEVG